MAVTAVELVKRYYGSLAPGRRHDLPSILDPGFVLELQEGFPGARPDYKGLKSYFEDFLELIYGSIVFEFIPGEFLECGTRVVTTGRMKGQAIPSSLAFDIPFVHIWTWNGRTLSQAQFFSDTALLRDAIDGRPISLRSTK
jgi:ketosteroid isomerase-like protein